MPLGPYLELDHVEVRPKGIGVAPNELLQFGSGCEGPAPLLILDGSHCLRGVLILLRFETMCKALPRDHLADQGQLVYLRLLIVRKENI